MTKTLHDVLCEWRITEVYYAHFVMLTVLCVSRYLPLWSVLWLWWVAGSISTHSAFMEQLWTSFLHTCVSVCNQYHWYWAVLCSWEGNWPKI